ncbi:outer membrane beta-barrel protein [Algoriphagus halophilus]|uniref:Outer membrane protein beta-barrel domain-containing protein n=1 Tax=Algoriphagus halophilus TaxID=226505 RepID=A0A1N6EFG9_9BACT|nr:outer membrane beta-barrel protein [Algoriphagus halophilus]SIN81782.1 Outer membrane protein beta-barrel domain-containing protein [Algoriphagus halophilus]
MKNIFITTLLFIGISFVASAQNSLFSVNYVVTVPLGNTSDYIDNPSGRGINFEFQKFINPHVAVGLEAGHTTLYKREEDKVYTEGSASISGVQYRYQYTWPILATVNYYALRTGLFRPYAGLGIGTMASNRRLDMGIYTTSKTHWQFAIKPEVGALIQPNASMAFKFGAKYLMGTGGDNFDSQSNINFNIGFVIFN